MKLNILLLVAVIATGCSTTHQQILEDDFCKTGPSSKIEYKSEIPLAADEGLVAGIMVSPANLLGQNFYINSDTETYRYCRASGFFIFKLKTGKYKLSITRDDFKSTSKAQPIEFQVTAGQVFDLGTFLNTCDDWSVTEGNKTRFIDLWKTEGPKAFRKTDYTFKKSMNKQCLLIFSKTSAKPLKDSDSMDEFLKKNSSIKWVQPPETFYSSDFF